VNHDLKSMNRFKSLYGPFRHIEIGHEERKIVGIAEKVNFTAESAEKTIEELCIVAICPFTF
jgi:hypothetical protein